MPDIGNNYTNTDARVRWGEPNRIPDSDRVEVEKACPYCAAWLIDSKNEHPPFGHVVECTNLMCSLLPTGGCYWEPWPEGWTDKNMKLLEG